MPCGTDDDDDDDDVLNCGIHCFCIRMNMNITYTTSIAEQKNNEYVTHEAKANLRMFCHKVRKDKRGKLSIDRTTHLDKCIDVR